MPDSSSWGTDPKKQPEPSASPSRLNWLLVPMFVVALVSLGLAVVSWLKINDLEGKVKGVEKTIDDVSKAMHAKRADEGGKLIYAANGLTSAERADFYHLAEGSEVFPLLWLQALRTENDKYFLDDVERLGFLPDPDNKDGLPVGLTSGVTIGLEPVGPMVGLNCAACHVGELHYQGKRLRIDGAPNLLNTREFFKSLIDSSLATVKDPNKLIAFLAKINELEESGAANPPSKRRLLVRKLVLNLARRDDDVFHSAIKPILEKIMAEESASDVLDLKALVGESIKDEQALRAKLTKDLKLDDLPDLVKKSKLLKNIAEDDRESTLKESIEDVYISLRLMRARLVFLRKLAPVGKDERTNWGPGRVDAFGSARTFLFDDKYLPVHPVSYPPLFDLDSHKWFHYDNNTNTFLERNFGQALGVGAVYDPKTLNSTLQPHNLIKLENLARKLSAPKWPEEHLGKIDADRAKKGEKLYAKYCAACHDQNAKGDAFERLYDLDDIKTDPARALSFAEKLPDGRPFFEAIKATLFDLKTKEIANFPPAEKAAIEKQPVEWRGPGKYSARSIKGSWATAPYLHNGSVPTMDDLLKPAKERPVKFSVGSHEFDVEKLGYKNDATKTIFYTTTPGNSNAGHEGDRYGTNMSADERKDLLEYLKTQ